MAGERRCQGIRGRLRIYLTGEAAVSGLGEAALDRALADLALASGINTAIGGVDLINKAFDIFASVTVTGKVDPGTMRLGPMAVPPKVHGDLVDPVSGAGRDYRCSDRLSVSSISSLSSGDNPGGTRLRGGVS